MSTNAVSDTSRSLHGRGTPTDGSNKNQRHSRHPVILSGGERPLSPWQRTGLLAVLFLMGLYFLLPVWWLLVSSTKNSGELFSSFGFWFGSHVNFMENLHQLFSYDNDVFMRWIVNTLLYAGVGAAIATLFAAAAGYTFAKFDFFGKRMAFSFVLGGMMIPVTALALPLYLTFNSIHATNTYWSVFLPSLVSPFGVYLARIYASTGVPNELLDAARIDGAREWRVFTSVGLRLMGPSLVTIMLFQFVTIWNNFFLPLVMLSNDRLYPVTLGLYQLDSVSTYGGAPPDVFGMLVMGVLISVVPLIVAFLLVQRFWRGGVSAGGLQ